MSQEFFLEATDSTPICEISVEKSSMLLSGVSMPENANEFYAPIIEKIDTLFKNASGQFTLKIQLSYMNSMSNKQLLRLMKHIEGMSLDLKVVWKYQPEDDLMIIKESGLHVCESSCAQPEALA